LNQKLNEETLAKENYSEKHSSLEEIHNVNKDKLEKLEID